MKRNTPKKQSWKLILAITVTGITSAFGGAGSIPIENPSFELNSNGNEIVGSPLFSLGTPDPWVRYFSSGDEINFSFGLEDADFTDGSLYVDILSPVYEEVAPAGNRVLILFTGNQWDSTVAAALGPDAIVEYGVEQQLAGQVLQGATLYLLHVDVGNIHDTSAEPAFPLAGFPGYRIQLLAGGVVIAEDINEEVVGDGEFVSLDLVVPISPTHPQIGEELSIRLINMNLAVPEGNYREVNFDNVRLDFVPGHYIPGDKPAAIDPHFQFIPGSGSPKGSSEIERFFTITGKGKKRLLLAGRGPSLHTRMVDLIQDPTVMVLDEKGKVVARSDDWATERDASEISKVLGRDKAHRRDAGVVVELPAGDYSVVVKPSGKESGYASSEIYDLDPESKASLQLPDAAERELREIWK